MWWHEVLGVKNGVLKLLVDSEAWWTFHASYVDFFTDPRNVRLTLSIDRFETFKSGANHSIWLVTCYV